MADAAKIKLLRQDRRFYFCVNVVLTLLVITIIYPIILVISSSFLLLRPYMQDVCFCGLWI